MKRDIGFPIVILLITLLGYVDAFANGDSSAKDSRQRVVSPSLPQKDCPSAQVSAQPPQARQPVTVPERPCPQGQSSNPQPPVSPYQKLEDPLVKLSSALTHFLETRSEKENVPTKLVDFLSKLATLLATMLGCYVTYKGIRKIPWFKEHQGLITVVLAGVVSLVLFYLLSGLVTSVLYALIAVLILLTALVLAAAHLIKFIDDKYPDVRDNILAYFSDSSAHRSMDKIVRDNIRNMHDWLSNIVFIQRLNGDLQLDLDGSFVEGYDKSTFEIQPDERLLSYWENVNDKMLVPIKARLTVANSQSGLTSEVVNVQAGLVVIRSDQAVAFKKFDSSGFQRLGVSLLARQTERMKKLMEEQQRWATNMKLFNSQKF